MKETQILKANHLSKNGVIIADDTYTVFPNVDKNNKTIGKNHKSTKNQNLPNKNIYRNNSSGKPLPSNSNYTRNQSPYNSSYRGRSPERGHTRSFSQNRYNRSNSQNNQNNYSRSNSNTIEFVSESSSQSNPRNRHYSNNQSRNSSCNRNRNYSHNRNRSYSNNRNQNYPNNRSRKISYNKSNYHRSNDNYQNRSRNNSQNRNSS